MAARVESGRRGEDALIMAGEEGKWRREQARGVRGQGRGGFKTDGFIITPKFGTRHDWSATLGPSDWLSQGRFC